MRISDEIPKLPQREGASDDRSTFQFKFRRPGTIATSPQGGHTFQLSQLTQRVSNIREGEHWDAYSLCVVSKQRYEDVYNRICDPYYLMVGVTSKLVRVCHVVFADQTQFASMAKESTTACVSPLIYWHFRQDPSVTIERYISFVYRPLPVARKLVVQEVQLDDTQAFGSRVDPLTKERLFAVQTELIVCPKDILYCFVSATTCLQPVPIVDPRTARAYKILSIEYEGPGKETYTASLPSAVGDIGLEAYPGFLANNTTTVIAQLEGLQHDYINYPAIGYSQSLLGRTLSCDLEPIKAISTSVNTLHARCLELIHKHYNLVRATLAGSVANDRRIAVRMLAHKLNMRIEERDAALAFTLNEAIDLLTKDLDTRSPSIIVVENCHAISTIISATYENQKLPEKHLQEELISVLKERYLKLQRKLQAPLIILYLDSNADDLLAPLCDCNATIQPLSVVEKTYLISTLVTQLVAQHEQPSESTLHFNPVLAAEYVLSTVRLRVGP